MQFACCDCLIEFPDYDALLHHLQTSPVHTLECEMCGAQFNTEDLLLEHKHTLGHVEIECEVCGSTFPSQEACAQHMNALGHFKPAYQCDVCGAEFFTQGACDQHIDALRHWTPEHYCSQCDRSFDSENNLRQHLNSRIHLGSNIACPFCSNAYATATGLAAHLESGACRAGVTRDTLYHTVRRRDPGGIITKKMIDWYPGGPRYHEETRATEKAFNGFNYQCYLCSKTFGALLSLNSHLNSPVHRQKLYHCPDMACRREFVGLAGLVNHLESETCGVMRFGEMQNCIGGIVTGQQRIAF